MAVGEVQGRLNLIWNLVMGIMTAAGAIVLAWGIFEFAAAYQHHDTSGRTSAWQTGNSEEERKGN